MVRYLGALPSLLMNAANSEAKLRTSPSRIAPIAVARRLNRLWVLTDLTASIRSSKAIVLLLKHGQRSKASQKRILIPCCVKQRICSRGRESRIWIQKLIWLYCAWFAGLHCPRQATGLSSSRQQRKVQWGAPLSEPLSEPLSWPPTARQGARMGISRGWLRGSPRGDYVIFIIAAIFCDPVGIESSVLEPNEVMVP